MSTLKTNNIQHVDRSDPSIIINTDGSVNIAGTMTYEDVTNVDAVGIITGRNNIDAQKQVLVGTGVSVKAGGLNVTAGITTVQALQATTGTFTGDVDIADKIVHTGDTDTAIRFSSADTISIETGGITRATVTGNTIDFPDAGTLRFGTSQDLQIYHGTGGASNIIHSNTSQPLIIHASGAGTIRFDTNSNERLRIDSNGMIGIGGVTPKTQNTFDAIEFGKTGFLGSQTAARTVEMASNAYYNSGWKYKEADVASQYYQYQGAHHFTSASSGSADGAITFTEKFRITSLGQVGISTGNIDPDGNQLLIRAASTVGTTKGHIMLTGDGATNGEGPQIVFSESGSGSNFAGAYVGHVREGSNSTGRLVFATRATGGDASTVPTERLRIGSDGTLTKYWDGSTIQAAFGGSSQVNGVTAVPSMAGTPFVVGRDTGTTRSAHFAGNLKFDSGYGLDYSSTGDGNGTDSSELFDDYEEGSFTPAYEEGSGGGNMLNNVTYNNTIGYYTKIGGCVTFSLRIQCSSHTVIGGHVKINGLPYAQGASNGKEGGAFFNYSQAVDTSNSGYLPTMHISNNASAISFYTTQGNAYQAGAGGTNWNLTLHITGLYHTF